MKRYLDITGQKYNRLTAVDFLFIDKNRQAVWSFLCDCGNIVNKTANTVRSNTTKSCGCLNREVVQSRTFLSFAGRKHTEISKSRIGQKLSGRKRSTEEIRQSADKLIGRKYSEDHKKRLRDAWTEDRRKKFGELHKGENNPFYKDGKWKERASEREVDARSPEYKAWRVSVFERDNYTCQDCGERGRKLEAHHIETWVNNKEKRHDVDNGLTLCGTCHKKKHRQKGRKDY